jgi:hypothetical protein
VSEKLKKVAKRHEMQLQRLTEVHEARCSELRGLVSALATQLRPLQEASRAHGAQIEEVSAGLNIVSELLRQRNAARAGGGESLRQFRESAVHRAATGY